MVLLSILLPINEGISFGLGFSHMEEGNFWSAGYTGALLDEYPLARLYDFEHPALFSANNMHRETKPISASFSLGGGPWAAAGEGFFAIQGDTLTSDRLIHGRARAYRDMGNWACGLGFSYSDFSYKQRTLGSWRNWAMDTRTVLPDLSLVFPAGDGYLSTTMSAGYAESVGGDMLLPVGMGVVFVSGERSVRFSYMTLSNTAAARGLFGVSVDGTWKFPCGTGLAAAGRVGVGVGGSMTRYSVLFSSTLTHNLGFIVLGDYLRAASYLDDSVSALAVQDGLSFEINAGPVSLIARPQATYYSVGQWKYGALGGVAVSFGPVSAKALAGRFDLSEGFAVEGGLEVKLW